MPSKVIITSSSNPSIKRLRALLTRRRVRYRERLFVAEGRRAVTTLLAQGSEPIELILSDLAETELVDQLIEASHTDGPRVTYVSDALLKQTLDTVSPQAVAAVFSMRPRRIPDDLTFVLVVDGVRDPGNLGAIVRLATAANVDVVVAFPGTVDQYNPKVVRGSSGLIDSVPLIQSTSLAEVVALFDARPAIRVADAAGPTMYTDVDWTLSTALIVGGEAAGAVTANTLEVDDIVRIPMRDGVESLNVAASTAVLLFEADRQKRLIQSH